jgi:hypothetical protein
VSDGSSWNAPADPGPGAPPPPVAIPVTGVDPMPLPLPPGTQRAAGEHMSTRRITAIVLAVVVGVLALCSLAGLAVNSILGPGFFSDSSGPSGVLATRWAGAGRYAVLDYASSGTDATTSVVAYDTVSLQTRKLDGYRLVAAEPSSTTVWVTRAVDPSQDSGFTGVSGGVPAPSASDSAWSAPDYNGPETDGPGQVWAWDAALGGLPTQEATPTWQPWIGPAGITAELSIAPTVGLWPSKLAFSVEGSAPVEADVADIGSFLPIGWSPSGDYLALSTGYGSSDSAPLVTILDARTGTVVASYSGAGNGPTDDSYTEFDGAAWDPVRDVLWVCELRTVGQEATTSTLVVTSLDTSGALSPLASPPPSWKNVQGSVSVAGTGPDGVLVSVDGDNGPELWRIGGWGAVGVALSEDLGVSRVDEGSYSPTSGLLVITGSGAFSNGSDAVLVDLKSRLQRTIWPLGR